MSVVNAASRRITLALALLVGGPAFPSEAEVLKPVGFTIRNGEVREVDLSLGNDGRSDLALRAEVLPADVSAWPEEDLQIGFPEDTTGGLVGLTMISPNPEGRRLRLRVEAASCCAGGDYKANIRLNPVDATTGASAGPSLVQPVIVTVAPRFHCSLSIAKAFGGTLFVGLAYFFGRNIHKKSHLLSAATLAQGLIQQSWSSSGEAIERKDGRSFVEGEAKRQLRALRRDRARAWLRANPLRIGISGRSYNETFRLRLGKNYLSLEVVGQQPSLEKGSLFVVCTGKSLTFLGKSDDEDRISGLQVVRKGSQLTGAKLLEPYPKNSDTNAGWQI